LICCQSSAENREELIGLASQKDAACASMCWRAAPGLLALSPRSAILAAVGRDGLFDVFVNIGSVVSASADGDVDSLVALEVLIVGADGSRPCRC
jgi:hypothetical protein